MSGVVWFPRPVHGVAVFCCCCSLWNVTHSLVLSVPFLVSATKHSLAVAVGTDTCTSHLLPWSHNFCVSFLFHLLFLCLFVFPILHFSCLLTCSRPPFSFYLQLLSLVQSWQNTNMQLPLLLPFPFLLFLFNAVHCIPLFLQGGMLLHVGPNLSPHLPLFLQPQAV